jgi:sugar/nucleoside kinase (ribokinase family)
MTDLLDVLTVSDMAVDVILDTETRPHFGQTEVLIRDYALEVGGSANIFASQFKKLGGRVGVVGKVGADAAGDFVLEKLARIGVDLQWVARDERLKTGMSTHINLKQDRGIMTYLGSIDAVGPEDLAAVPLSTFRHWHVASYFLLDKLRPCWPAWFERLRAAKKTISLDPNCDPEGKWASVRELLPLVDVFLPNAAEAMAISGEPSAPAAGQALSLSCPLVVVKCGKDGAVAFRRGEQLHPMIQAATLARIADTTGAGDSFDAGFLRAWLLDKPIERCLEVGVRCGSTSLSALGGIEAQYAGDVA